MKIQIDQSRCQGHAQCNAWAPEFYPLDDAGYIDLDGQIEVAPELEKAAKEGASACPERVITIL